MDPREQYLKGGVSENLHNEHAKMLRSTFFSTTCEHNIRGKMAMLLCMVGEDNVVEELRPFCCGVVSCMGCGHTARGGILNCLFCMWHGCSSYPYIYRLSFLTSASCVSGCVCHITDSYGARQSVARMFENEPGFVILHKNVRNYSAYMETSTFCLATTGRMSPLG